GERGAPRLDEEHPGPRLLALRDLAALQLALVRLHLRRRGHRAQKVDADDAGLVEKRGRKRLSEPALQRLPTPGRGTCPKRQETAALPTPRRQGDLAAEAHRVAEVRQDALRPLAREVEPQDVWRAADRLGAVGLVDVEVLSGPGGGVVAPAAPEPRD